jgi:hypothetical protein
MQLAHAVSGLESAVETQLRVAGPEAAELGAQLMAALKPAIQQALMDVVAMAATEVASQLPGQRVDIRLVDGDPELIVAVDAGALAAPLPTPQVEDDEARITLRLPGYLKDLIHEAASMEGDSVNSFVVETLRTQAQTKATRGSTRHRGKIAL